MASINAQHPGRLIVPGGGSRVRLSLRVDSQQNGPASRESIPEHAARSRQPQRPTFSHEKVSNLPGTPCLSLYLFVVHAEQNSPAIDKYQHQNNDLIKRVGRELLQDCINVNGL